MICELFDYLIGQSKLAKFSLGYLWAFKTATYAVLLLRHEARPKCSVCSKFTCVAGIFVVGVVEWL